MTKNAPNDVGRAYVGWMMGGLGIARVKQADQQSKDEQKPMEALGEIRLSTMADLKGCRIVSEALAGSLSNEDYANYLTNVYHYARFSPVIMAAAAARCCTENEGLATYLLRHSLEEQGHEKWALADLEKLGVSGETVVRARPTLACAALVGYVHDLATSGNPAAIMGWMYILEAVGADIGSEVGAKLSENRGGVLAPVQFVAGHGAADASHFEDISRAIEGHIQTPEDRRDVCEAARVVSYLYTTMFRQVGNEQAGWAWS